MPARQNVEDGTQPRPRRPGRRGRLAALMLATALLALAVAGCGGDDASSSATTDTEPTASIPKAPPPPADATGPTASGSSTATTPTGPTGATGTSTSPEDQPGGAGDEQPIRVPATFTARDGRLTPATITVPAFLALRVTIASGDGNAHEYVVHGRRDVHLKVPAGGRAAVTLEGLRAGRYGVEPVAGGGAGATIVSGGEPGP